ncbi:hypothetical protein ACJMK2_011495 [Sinanodonta woodiana]|uniref:Gametogenetin-binding protein 2 n=1 Tax=Sinanodonta woodiana TaxID=1069815 RepID=A0ABD3V8D4_SINWO
MAKLVAVCRTDDYQFERRQLPIVVDENLTMVVQFTDKCINCDRLCNGKQKDLERFVHKFGLLTKDEIAVAMMVTRKDIMNLLTHDVPCVGCRRSVERLFNQLVQSKLLALDPLLITKSGVMSVNRNLLFDPRALYSLFYIHGARLNSLIGSIPKSKKNKRCNLHTLETHKTRTASSWLDIWELLSQECREEVVLVDADSLLETLENYLCKHRFCSECKSKVLQAYRILVGEVDSSKEKAYCPALYEGLRCCPQERHIHMLCDTDFITRLIDRAEPELIGSQRRDRHAKTLDIAQEEVLTCLGIHTFERLHKILQKLKSEEQTWQILFYLGVDALRQSFEMALERKQGVSNLELLCEELLEEERVKEHRREQKRQKRKKKKAKSGPISEEEDQITKDDKEICHCDKASSTVKTSSCGSTAFETHHHCADYNSNTTLASLESCRKCDAVSLGSPQLGQKPTHLGSQFSDYGYSSGAEGCENLCLPGCTDSSHSSCSDGVCYGQNAVKCNSCLADQETWNSSSSPSISVTQDGHSRSQQCKCDVIPRLKEGMRNRQCNMTYSLQDLLENGYCSSDEDTAISEEEIKRFKEDEKEYQRLRLELRETLRRRFDNMQQQQRGSPKSLILPPRDLDKIAQKLCQL